MASLFKRGPVYWAGYRLNGKKVNVSLGTRDERKARRALGALEERLEKGEVKAPEEVMTIDAFVEKYESHYVNAGGPALHESRERSWKADSAALRSFLDFAKRQGVKRVGMVEMRHVEAYRDWRLTQPKRGPKEMKSEDGKAEKEDPTKIPRVSGATVNKALRVGKAAWSWAIRRGFARDPNPFKGVPAVKLPRYEPHALSEFEVRKLLDAARGDALYPLVATATYAGLRNAELRALEWDDVDFKGGVIRVRCDESFLTKSRKPRVVPIAPELRAILEPVAKTSGPCFPAPEGGALDESNLCKEVQRIAKAAGVSFSLHALRRSFATILVDRGVPAARVRDYCGHASLSTTEGYYLARGVSGGQEDVARLSFGAKPAPAPSDVSAETRPAAAG